MKKGTKNVGEEKPGTVDEGYDKVKNLIFDQVYKFKLRYGGDLEDLVSEANMAFVKGHRAFVEGNGTCPVYPTEIRRWVWYELFDAMRVRLERKRNVTFSSTADQEDVYAEPVASSFNVEEFERKLSEDARVAAGLVLTPPPIVETVALAKGGTPRNYRSTVRAYLRQDVGWTTERINEAFAEITSAL